MDRINSSGYIIVNGRRVFNDDPLAPTIIDAEWLNGVQEEICTAIEDTGMQLKRNIPCQLSQSVPLLVQKIVDSWITLQMTKIWTARSSAATNLFEDMDINPSSKRLVAIGDNGTTAKVLISDDGVGWTVVTPGITKYWHGLCFSSDLQLWIIVGGYLYTTGGGALPVTYHFTPTVGISDDDGNTWNAVSPPSGSTRRSLRSVIWCRDLSMFIAVGDPDVGYNDSWTGSNHPATVYTSIDGSTWTPRTVTPIPYYHSFSDIAWSSDLKLLVAVGSYFMYITGGSPIRPCISISLNGRSWTSMDHGRFMIGFDV